MSKPKIEIRNLVDGCHCDGETVVYRTRKVTNNLGLETIKTYHQCVNCRSRHVDITVPVLDNAKSVNVLELYHQSRTMPDTNFSIVTPSAFIKCLPWDSVLQKVEAEIIALNIMKILNRTDNTWRQLTWEEYQEERKKDKGFSTNEKGFFDQVVSYTTSPDAVAKFCKDWELIARVNEQPQTSIL